MGLIWAHRCSLRGMLHRITRGGKPCSRPNSSVSADGAGQGMRCTGGDARGQGDEAIPVEAQQKTDNEQCGATGSEKVPIAPYGWESGETMSTTKQAATVIPPNRVDDLTR